MPMFDKSIETFLGLIIDHWDEIYATTSYRQCCRALYTLYYTETVAIVPSKSEDEFAACMRALVQLHKDTGGTVKLDQHGYTEFHTNMSLLDEADLEGEPYRVYVNASTKNVIVLGRILVKLACLDAKALYFKIADSAEAVDARKDAIVIYVFGKARAEEIAAQLTTITDNKLTPTSPGLTKEIAPGISIAVDPSSFSNPVSFGEDRVRPFATAILCYRDEFAATGLLDGISKDVRTQAFRFLLAGAFRAHGINALMPFTSAPAGTREISNRRDTAASAVKVPNPEKLAARLLINGERKRKTAGSV
jgi:hypothetical protein